MLKSKVQKFLNTFNLSLHRKQSVDQLRNELEALRASIGHYANAARLQATGSTQGNSDATREIIRAEMALMQSKAAYSVTTEDYGADEKKKKAVASLENFGEADFADLCSWLFASSLNNHRIIHQRIDEGSLLWRTVKRSSGPILEIGRAAGGSTVAILGASGDRSVVSIDRDPQHNWIVDTVFSRPDVSRRLKLYTQSSREIIPETEFGMMFIDGDHSYEGICHDIASFWNCLKSFDNKPALAVFHDAAENPISYVEPVRQACQELVADSRVARVVETWGSMLAVEKVGDISPEHWYAKEDQSFWTQFSDNRRPQLSPKRLRWRLKKSEYPRKGPTNLFGSDNLDNDFWIKTGVTLKRELDMNADNPARHVREIPEMGVHCLARSAPLNLRRFGFTIFIRPLTSMPLRMSISDSEGKRLSQADFHFKNQSEILNPKSAENVEIIDAGLLYGNGFFRCELSIDAQRTIPTASFAIQTLGPDEQELFMGDPSNSFFVNLASVREIYPK